MATRHLQRPGHPSSVLLLPMVIKALTVVINYGLAAPGARAVGKPGLGLIDKSALDRKASSRPLLLGQAVLPQDRSYSVGGKGGEGQTWEMIKMVLAPSRVVTREGVRRHWALAPAWRQQDVLKGEMCVWAK